MLKHIHILALGLLTVFGFGMHSWGQTPYYLTVEGSPAVGSGGTVYRFFVQMQDETDRMSAVFGNDQASLILETPDGAFNSSFNSSWSASGINPAFLPVFPELADDSYATIGLTGPASTSGILGAADPSLVEDPIQPLTPYFTTPGATSLEITTLTGASWYISNTAANGLPDDDMRVLIAQVTTTGSISGQINYQVFPLGVGTDQQQISIPFEGEGVFGLSPAEGCTDFNACNYDSSVGVDDGSCEYTSCAGCTDAQACNYDAEATIPDEASCVFCDCGASGSGYTLVVEAEPAAAVPGATRYRLKIRMASSQDQMSAVFGVQGTPLQISAPLGIFNSTFNSSWNASGINPAFLSAFPDLADDSYATIGLTGPASTSGIADAADPSIAENVNQPITPFFVQNGSTELLINSITGSSWFALNTAGNTFPDAFNDVLVAQLTSFGDISGTINVQVLPEGVTGIGNDIQKTFEFDGAGLYAAVGEGNACGCTDPEACNYNPEATEDDGTCDYFSCAQIGCTDSGACNYDSNAIYEDGSCLYLDAIGVCGGDCQSDANGNGLCDAGETTGCTDAAACNYNADATLGDGSCIPDVDDDGICDDVDDCVGAYDACGVCNGPGAIYACGCTDLPDGDCDCEGNQLDALGVCGGDCVADADSDGVCDDVDDCVGAYDTCGVCNGPGAIYECGCATIPDGDCDCNGNQLDALGVCGGGCAEDTNANGICDSDEIEGCTDAEALNFNEAANVDDGSCVGADDLPVGWDFAATPMSAVFLGNVTIDGAVIQELAVLGAFSESGVCVGWTSPVTVDGVSYVSLTLYGDDETTEVVDGMQAGEDFSLRMHLADSDTTLTYRQNGTLALLSGWTNTNGAPLGSYGDPAVTYDFSLFAECQDPLACNYNPESTSNEGCEYPPFAYGCDGQCLNDSDGDGTCDEFELLGCTDVNACNFNSAATEEDGSCKEFDECGVCGGDGIPAGDCDCDGNQLDALGVCGGDCAADADADGICDDVDDCVGEPDECGICNGPGAIYECGCSDIPEGDCDCDGNQLDALGECGGACVADEDADGICDDVDDCVGAYDACGVCNGPGDIYECGCSDIPEGDCDCNGNQLDVLGVCGGECAADTDMDGICDDVDDCVGAYDACGICNGPGDIYECGCSDIPEGDCDCDGNQLDAVGVCGGDCAGDADEDGICDDVDDCVGAYDACGVCNGPGEIYECGCSDIPEGDCDCDGNQLDAVDVCGGDCAADADMDGICDDVDDCVGEYDAIGMCNGACLADLDGDGVCDDSETLGCDDPLAINFDESATENDGSCNYEGLEAPVGFQFTPGPSSGTILGTVTVDGLAGTGLDWIGAFTPQGVCAGASNLTVFEGQSYASLTIYGDDPTTPEVVEGMEAGGTFSLRLYDQSEDLIVSYNGGQQFSGWINTNGGALPGFSNPETVYAFFTPACPDTDGDGICNDEDDCPDQAADAIGVCGGNCPYDFNNNGVCDDAEVFGCTYETATNYNPAATTDDGTCEIAATGDETVWATCFGDLNGDGLIQLNDLLDILTVYGTACE